MSEDAERPGDGSQDDHEAYLRWQQAAITQLGYTINLLMTITVAILSFTTNQLLVERKFLSMAYFPLFWLLISLPALAFSVLSALAANVTRSLDFRRTRAAALARLRDGREHPLLHRRAERMGRLTWHFFFAQTILFTIGACALSASIWLGIVWPLWKRHT